MAEAIGRATAATPLNRQSSGPLKRGTSHFDLDYQVGLNPDAIKAQFVQKVYGILGAQVALTVAIVAAFIYHKPTQEFGITMLETPGIMWIQLLILIPLICAIGFYKDKYPHNLGMLFALTAFEGIFIGAICGAYAHFGKADAIVYAGGTTAFIFFTLSAYVMYSGQDFSFLGSFLFVAVRANLGLGLIAYIFAWSFMIWLYHIAGVLIFSGYIIYDTDQIVNKVQLEDCDTGTAVWGALELYLDLINLFMHLLALFGGRD
jgi:FtsH-binding integral membrane protein